MDLAVEVKEVSKRFDQLIAVKDLSFQVNKGEIFGFLGPNGSGKSTTLRMILSLIKPSSGEINLFGKSLLEHRSELMKQIGCIIEKPDFYKYLTAHDNLKLVARASQINYSHKNYKELYSLVGLLGREQDKVKTYSHGMKQRLGIAQALIHDPNLIILDEPNTGLDPKGIIELRNLLLQLNKERGKTILFSSHILSEVEELCDSLVVINKGHTVAQGKVGELLSNEDLLVDVEVSNPEDCIAVLRESHWHSFLKSHREQHFKFNLRKEDLPALNQFLMEHQIGLISTDYRKRLEDYFLRITDEN